MAKVMAITAFPARASLRLIDRLRFLACIASIPAFATVATAQVAPNATPSVVQQTPPATTAPQLAQPQPQPQPQPDPTIWSAAEIAKELGRCNQILRGLDVVARPVQQIRQHACGAPAPVELISIGWSPQVSFSPPVTVTCDMVAALHKWITRDLQPLARKHLGSEIVRLDTMSSYSCRTAYSRKNAKLSEHGKANAVDIRAFMTANGTNAEVLLDWGPTGREIAAQVAAAKKLEAERATAAAKAHQGQSGTATATATARQAPPAAIATGSIDNPDPAVTALRPSIIAVPRNGQGIGLTLPGSPNTGLGLSAGPQPSHLGGPPADKADTAVGPRTDFLRAAHAAACKVFGTVLGPEANAAHRNHFHVDMAERKIKVICE